MAAAVVKKVSTSRQVSEEDEIAKIKKQNKSGTSSEAAAPLSPTVTRPPEPLRKTPVPEVEPEVNYSCIYIHPFCLFNFLEFYLMRFYQDVLCRIIT